MKNIITIELLGEEFKFRAEDDNAVISDEIAARLMEEVRRAELRFPNHLRKTNKLAILLMAALNITKQHIQLVREHSDFIQTVSSRAARLDRMIKPGI